MSETCNADVHIMCDKNLVGSGLRPHVVRPLVSPPASMYYSYISKYASLYRSTRSSSIRIVHVVATEPDSGSQLQCTQYCDNYKIRSDQTCTHSNVGRAADLAPWQCGIPGVSLALV